MRVTGGNVDLGGKLPYEPALARERARVHADHFAWLIGDIARTARVGEGGVIVAPFDTELFGHWWFEGVDFIGDLYRGLGVAGRAPGHRPRARGGASPGKEWCA